MFNAVKSMFPDHNDGGSSSSNMFFPPGYLQSGSVSVNDLATEISNDGNEHVLLDRPQHIHLPVLSNLKKFLNITINVIRPYTSNLTPKAYRNTVGRRSPPFSHVFGRLGLLTNERYPVSRGELTRRITSDECFNLSMISNFLRRPKVKDGAKNLRDELSSVGLTLNKSRRKPMRRTCFTMMTEGESIQLARDIQKSVETQFPASDLAQYCNKQAIENLSAQNQIYDDHDIRNFWISKKTPLPKH